MGGYLVKRLMNFMIDFLKKSNLLLSTAMIESGLDISNVNTIIIIDKPNLLWIITTLST